MVEIVDTSESVTSPLNPGLYGQLVAQFARVRITNPGEQGIVIITTPWTDGKPHRYADYKGGEHYYVACPKCGDTQQRMGISHFYGRPHAVTGRPIDFLVHCNRKKCFKTRGDYEWFAAWLMRRSRSPASNRLPSMPQQTVVTAARAPALPSGFVPLTQLPANHRAWQYLEARGFDPRVLGATWGVGYVERALDSSPAVFRRLVIPIYQPAAAGRVVLAGWQARQLDDEETEYPKYLNSAGLRKSSCLYGLLEAIGSKGPVVLVEGVIDVCSFGVGAIASFGRDLSRDQIQLITHHLRGRPIMVGYDPDSREEAADAAQAIRQARARVNDSAPVLICPPPEGAKDFGVCTQGCACGTVWGLLEEQRIVVSSQNVLHVYGGVHRTPESANAHVAIAYPPTVSVGPEETLVGSRAGFAIGAETPSVLHTSPARLLRDCPKRIYFNAIKGRAHEIVHGYPAPAEIEDVQIALHLLVGGEPVEQDRVIADYAAMAGLPKPPESDLLATHAQLTNDLWADGALLDDLAAQGLAKLYNDIEKPCVPALANMMARGLMIDIAGLQAAVTNCVIPDTVIGTANSIIKLTNPATGRVHCDFSVTSAVTGRITASRPNLQGYPNALKQFAVAPAGYVLVEADQLQQEPTVLAELAGDTFSKEQFSKGVDYHRTTAATLLNKSIDAISNEERQLGKKFNLAMSYGSTVPGLAKVLGTTRAETIRYIDAFNAAHPAIQPWRQTIVSHLRKHGFVRTLFGRRRRLPAIASDNPAEVAKAERQAVNAVIQGTAAEIMKLALARLHTALPADCHLVLTVHDSVLVECPIEREAEVRDLLLKVMRQPPVDSWLPLEVSIKSGTSWGTMN